MICKSCKEQDHEHCDFHGCFCQHKKDAHVIRSESKND